MWAFLLFFKKSRNTYLKCGERFEQIGLLKNKFIQPEQKKLLWLFNKRSM